MSQIDWLASLAQLVGARLPKGAASDSEARLGNLLGTDTEGRPWVIEQSNTRVLSVRTPQWKFIEPSDGEKMISWGPKIETGNNPTPQLYDLSKEVYEKDNVAKENPDVWCTNFRTYCVVNGRRKGERVKRVKR